MPARLLPPSVFTNHIVGAAALSRPAYTKTVLVFLNIKPQNGPSIRDYDYISHAMENAAYNKLEDGTYSGRIPMCKGVVAFGATLRDCKIQLRSTLEDWILVGFKLGHSFPIIGDINLNREPHREQMETL